jgi:hypothetical protein
MFPGGRAEGSLTEPCPTRAAGEGAVVTVGVIGWTAAVMALGVAAVDVRRMRTAQGTARSAVGVEVLMAAVMAFMALPATAAAFSGQFLWAGAFAVVGLGCAAVGVRDSARAGWRHGRHWFHHMVGCGAMACMTLAMRQASAHAGMAAGMPGMAGTAGTAGTGEWAAACAVLALYFLLAMAVGLRSQVLGNAPAAEAVPVGRIAMGGIMAVMLILMM